MQLEAELAKLVGRFAAMRQLAARAARDNPEDVRAHFGAAMAFRISGDYRAAAAAFERASALEPANTHFLFELGATQEYLGQFEAAARSYAAALKAEPLNYKARHAMVQLQKQTIASNSIPELERQFQLPDADGWRTLHIGHALAKTYEDLGDTAKSFDWLTRAKRRRREFHPFDAMADAALADAALKAAPAAGDGCAGSDPIFVTGLPRSGTTLVDRILSSHPQVTSAGEIGNFLQLLKLMSGAPGPESLSVALFNHLGGVDWARLGRLYVDSTRPLTGAAPHFVDKAPSNYMLAPLILRALPNARIVCMRRHPLDSCLSNYKQIFPFEDRYHDYVYDLASTAQKFIQFNRVIEYWRSVLPADRFMILQYEDLVGDQEGMTRGLLAFCDLPWDERCLAFQENAAGVSTPSARQVRSPMNSAAVGRWAKYGSLLDPAREVLTAAGVAL
jgi:tetratricopeptide (TPR) repeat protein